MAIFIHEYLISYTLEYDNIHHWFCQDKNNYINALYLDTLILF